MSRFSILDRMFFSPSSSSLYNYNLQYSLAGLTSLPFPCSGGLLSLRQPSAYTFLDHLRATLTIDDRDMFATIHLPNRLLLLQLFLLCCSATAYMTRIPLQTSSSMHPSSSVCTGFVSSSRLCNILGNDTTRRIHPSRHFLLAAAASQKLGGDTMQTSDSTNKNNEPKKLQTNDNMQLDNNSNIDIDGFQLLVQKAIQTLVRSDTDGEELDHSYGSASQGLWVHAPAAKEMQGVLDKVVLQVRANVLYRGFFLLKEERCLMMLAIHV